MEEKAPNTRIAQMVTCHYCKKQFFVPTAELDKYTAQLEAEIERLKGAYNRGWEDAELQENKRIADVLEAFGDE